MHLFLAALLIAALFLVPALFGAGGTLPVVLILAVAAAVLVALWRSMNVRRPPDTRV
jgi:hypothetical protein